MAHRSSNRADSVSSITANAFGSPTLPTSVIGGRPAVRFDSIDVKDGFRVTKANSPLSGAEDFSVAVFFATSNVEPGEATDWYNGVGLVHADQRGFNRDWGLALHGGQVGAGIGRGLFQPSTSVFTAQTRLNDGEPHLVVFTRRAGLLTLHVDAAAPRMVDGASTEARDALELTFGVPSTAPGALEGDIAEVRVYDGALTVEEVASLRRDIDAFYQNSVPVANDDQFVVDEDATLFVGGDNGVLANDTDADNDPLSASVVQQAQNGLLALNANGTFIYAPNADFFGTDTFTYVVNDFRDSEPATVTIEVRPTDDPAIGVVDNYKAVPTEVLNVEPAIGVLTNDINIDQVPISAVLHRDASFGSVVLNDDGGFAYDAQGNTGLAAFSYRINDGGELSDPVQVLIVVNSPPVAVDDAFTVEEDSALVLDCERRHRH